MSTAPSDPTPRERHYGTFYGLTPPAAATGRPVVAVLGNCQAEALRVLLDASPVVEAVRMPPVFELTPADLPHLDRLLARTDILLTQPVRDDYAGLPVGSGQVAARLRTGAVVVRWPVIRWTGLHPYQAIIRDPRRPSHEPPLVPYHDLRTLSWAATGEDPWEDAVLPDRLREVAERSLAELGRRQARDCDVGIADLFARPEAGDMLTLNHPGNRVLIELARRVQDALGLPVDATDPGRVLLGSVVAPVLPQVDALWDLHGGFPDDRWRRGGSTIPAREVHQVQRAWYRQHPWIIEAGLHRHGDTLQLLGLGSARS